MFGQRHIIVVDLGFGDAGKGATVDWLCARLGDVAAVVRFNGGAQAAHNVVAEGRHHTFAQFGAGTLAGVPTLLSRHMLVEPIALAAEAQRLAALGVASPLALLTIDERALLTTPIHIAANRAREDARGSSRHGSCGRGIGETAAYALDHDAPRVGDCLRPAVLRRKLDALAAHYAPLIDGSGHTVEPIDALVAMYGEFARSVRLTGGGELGRLAARGRLIFEGAQGVLLDEWRGFHPHTTWSTVEPRNARALLAEIGAPGYVLGAGHYQGAFRSGHLDPILLRYAIEVCGGVDGLAVNHLDTGTGRAATAYDTAAGRIDRLVPGAWQDLDHQRRLTELLATARPVLRDIPADPIAWLESELGAPVVLAAHGPDRADRVRVGARAAAR
ncbi:adenylosuccinate synthetase [Nocardia thailandica]|uniref:Adenylosuccinate synthetase n=1 Tax=Nocardia thailandica TaxID=257275 RepID=A0ABW6PPK9_9NOCA